MDERDRFENFFNLQIAAGIRDGTLADTDISITTKMPLGALQWSIFWCRPKTDDSVQMRHAMAKKMATPLMHGLLA